MGRVLLVARCIKICALKELSALRESPSFYTVKRILPIEAPQHINFLTHLDCSRKFAL